MLDRLTQDLRYALRALAARPGFTAAAVLTLALGIGANAAIFNVIDALLLRPLPYPAGDRLVSIHNAYPRAGEDESGSTVPDYLDQRAQAPSLAEVAIYQPASFNLAAGGTVERVRGLRATPSLFPTLGVSAALGRTFSAADAVPGQDKVAIVSWDTWQNRYAGNPAIIGSDLGLDGASYRVIGVMPQGFFFPARDIGIWTPYAIEAAQRSDEARGRSDVESIGRLKPGATIAGLEAEFRTITARNAARSTQLRDDYAASGFVMHAQSLAADWFGGLTAALWLLQAMVAVVLLIAGANVVNLVLVRMNARRRDFALRAALGADRNRLARQILVETSLLALGGGVLGVLVARAATPLIGAFGFARTLGAYGPDLAMGPAQLAGVLGFALAVGLLLGLVTTLALRRIETPDLLRAGGSAAASGQGTGRTRDALVIGQFALTLMLLVAAGLLLKSFQRLLDTDPGFASANLVTARLYAPESSYADDGALAGYQQRLLDAVRAVPGVESAAYTSSLPFDGHLGTSGYAVPGYAGADADALVAERQSVDGAFFGTLGVPLLEGRAFGPGDSAGAAPVVIVDANLAQHIWPGRSAVGQRITLDPDHPEAPPVTVVGVARPVHQNDLAEAPTRDSLYWPYRQHPVRYGELVVKSALAPAALIPALRAAALSVDAGLPLYDIQTLDERIADSLDHRRAPMLMLTLFAALALLLAAIGLYGVLAFGIAMRTREFGVRLAIGAGRRNILALVAGSGLRLIAAGAAIGAIGALALGRVLRAQLHGIDGFDAGVFAAAVALLAAVALIACWLPVRRAMRVDPVIALRYE
jgi:predicted permease